MIATDRDPIVRKPRTRCQQLLAEAEKLAQIGSFEWDIRRNKVTWSEGLYHIYGLDPREFGASFEAFLNLVHASCREMVRKTIEQAFQAGKPFEMEEWIVRPDGEVRILFSKGEVIKNKHGKPIRLVGVCQDITERKQAREKELRQKLLEADNARKTRELEEARRLQVSMLPRIIPKPPDVDIAVYMKTAAEVGGDYYDFVLADDGTLTLAIGDATGHGLRAGMMVTATKSLFKAFARFPDPVQILRDTSKVLKSMGFRNLYMALTIAKLKDHVLQVAAAGIPFTLIYRAATNRIEEVVLKGMPLGRFLDFPYQKKQVLLQKGDTVLFMTDGLPDRFNRQQERLGEEQVKEAFSECGRKSPKAVIEHLLQIGDSWAQGRPPHDDMTFVVLQVK